MGYHRQLPGSRLLLATLLLALPGIVAWAEGPPADPGACAEERCLVVEHDLALAAEAGFVADALRRKLGPHGVAVVLDDQGRHDGDAALSPGTPPSMPWVVNLRALPPDWLLLTVTSPDPAIRQSVVRDFERGEDPGETARTIVLVVEEAVLPYLAQDAGQAPLGAGLAIIEPPEVGGIKASREPQHPIFPRLRCFEIGLGGFHLPATDDIIAGPRLRIEGEAAPRTTVAAGIGWAGSATFVAGGITGTASTVPIEALVGFVFLPGRIVELSAAGGFSMGFAVYRTTDGEDHRADVLFDPWLTLGLRAVLRIHGPWAIAVDGGAALVLVRDELLGGGGRVYLQDWLMPRLGLALQFWL